MPKLNDANWYAEERVMAYVYSLFAMHDVAVSTEVQNGKESKYKIDLVVDLSDQMKLTMPRRFAVEIRGFREFPSVGELSKQLAKDPTHRFAKTFEMPVLFCAVHFANLEALYCWIVEPIFEDGMAGLRIPDEWDWKEFQEEAVGDVLRKVKEF